MFELQISHVATMIDMLHRYDQNRIDLLPNMIDPIGLIVSIVLVNMIDPIS